MALFHVLTVSALISMDIASSSRKHPLLSCRPKIVDGRIQKFVAEQALLEQAFIKDTTKTVATVIKEAVATVGEKISIRRFERSAQLATPLMCLVH